MDVIVGLHASGALLVLLAGLAKVVRPGPTRDLLATLGLPNRREVALGLGLVEAILGVTALAVGGPAIAIVIGIVYLGFAVVVIRALAVGATSCGCFGRADAPPSWLHVVGNAGFAAVSFVAAAGDSPVEVLDRQPLAGVGFVILVGVVAGVALVAFTALPEALAARSAAPVAQEFRMESAEEGPS